MKVTKFGGSSMATAAQLEKVGGIIKQDPERKFIIVSAPGKRYKDDVKITDMLIQLGNQYFENEYYEHVLNKIITRFSEIIHGLNISTRILEEIEQTILDILSGSQSELQKTDALKSIGEDSSARILNEYLNLLGENASYLNPREAGIIVSNEPGEAQILTKSFKKLYTLRQRSETLVIPGFFGYTEDGQLTTFSRGGSDISGSVVAAGVKADLYENFTDVDSVFSVNPTIVENPKKITMLTYKEMRELSYAGFSVFHDEALIPAFKEGIPVCVKNTNNPTEEGTMIVSKKKANDQCVVGIAGDTGFCSLYISKYLMNRELGFGRKLLGILEDEGISFEHAPSGIDDISVIIREKKLTKQKEDSVLKRIENELQPDLVKIHRNLAMVMIVGEGMMTTVGIAQKATTAITKANVNIEMINQGSSEVSMMFGIQGDSLNQAVRSLYEAFFAS